MPPTLSPGGRVWPRREATFVRGLKTKFEKGDGGPGCHETTPFSISPSPLQAKASGWAAPSPVLAFLGKDFFQIQDCL